MDGQLLKDCLETERRNLEKAIRIFPSLTPDDQLILRKTLIKQNSYCSARLIETWGHPTPERPEFLLDVIVRGGETDVLLEFTVSGATTVLQLCRAVAKRLESVSPYEMNSFFVKLVFNHQMMLFHKTLDDYEIEKGDTVFMMWDY